MKVNLLSQALTGAMQILDALYTQCQSTSHYAEDTRYNDIAVVIGEALTKLSYALNLLRDA